MRLRQWRRRSIQSRLVMALGLLVAVALVAGGLGWAGLHRTEQALLRDHAAGLSDLRLVLGLAERSARLAAEAPALARASGDGMATREAEELRAGIAELRTLVATLPSSIRANASVPTVVPSIVRLAERLDGILDHLVPVIAEQVALNRDLARQRETIAELMQRPQAAGGAPGAREAQRALAIANRAFTSETAAAVEALRTRFGEESPAVEAGPDASEIASLLKQAEPVFALRIAQISATSRVQVFLAAVERAAAQLTATIRSLADAVEESALVRARATSAALSDGKLALLAGGALSLLAAILVAARLMRDVASNIAGATRALTRLADGDGSAQPTGLGRADEIGDLARAFQLFKAQALERDELMGQLRQAQKMEAIGQLTGGIAHDFNNLLAAISSNLQLISDQAATGSQTQARADRALDAVEHGTQMVQRLLAFARRQPLAPQSVEINRLIEDLVDLLGPGFGSELVLATDLDPSAPLVRVDPGQMEQALLNLVINARDAIAGPGRIEIRTRAAPDGAPCILVGVHDTGAGMSPDVAQRAFEPFFTTKAFGAGSGLGLSTVYGFVRQSGGTIAIESEPGQGTAILMSLPRARPGALAASARPEKRGPDRRRQRGRILIVEDDPHVRAATLDLVRSLGHEAEAVPSGEAALPRLRQERFDLLFTDIVLAAGMSGFELAEEARRLEPPPAVLCCSGFAGEARAGSEIPAAWSGSLLAKPYSSEELAARLETALRRRSELAA